MICVRKTYLIIASILFIIEILIASFIHDEYIRPYVGDFLVVMLIYCFIRGFFKISISIAALGALLFAYLIETLQYFKFVDIIGLGNSKLARVVIGSSFEWLDLLAYTLGILVILIIEWTISSGKMRTPRTQ